MSGEAACRACGGEMALDCWGCNYHDFAEGIEAAHAAGAAVAFGLMGMAEAIRARCIICDCCGAVRLDDGADACENCNTIYG